MFHFFERSSIWGNGNKIKDDSKVIQLSVWWCIKVKFSALSLIFGKEISFSVRTPERVVISPLPFYFSSIFSRILSKSKTAFGNDRLITVHLLSNEQYSTSDSHFWWDAILPWIHTSFWKKIKFKFTWKNAIYRTGTNDNARNDWKKNSKHAQNILRDRIPALKWTNGFRSCKNGARFLRISYLAECWVKYMDNDFKCVVEK